MTILSRRAARRRDGRAQWLAWRAQNALRTRLVLAGVIAATVFITALLTLALVPREANRTAQALAPAPGDRTDTARFVARLADARRRVQLEDSALALERVAAPVAMAPTDTFPPDVVFRRDSLRAISANLGRLIARAENAPLPASYRALAGASPLNANPSIAALVDTLTTIEHERDEFGIAGGADPIFVALTARATAVGRSIQDIARGQRAEIRRQIAAISPPPIDSTAMSAGMAADTLVRRQRIDSLQQVVVATSRALALARVRNQEVDRRADRARELANVAAPPGAMLAAALSLGLVVGFATALGAELRSPRLADAAEAERAADVRVIAVIEPRAPSPERTRRRADVDAPPLIDRTSEAYRLLYLNFAATGSALPLITVTGDEPAVTATVAANLAAASAGEARSTLLVDGDFAASAVAGVLRLRFEPGLADVIRGSHDWAEAVQTTMVGRDGSLDVMPSGAWRGAAPEPAAAEEIRRDLMRVVRRYDLAVLVAPEGHVARSGTSLLPAPDVLLCARIGATQVSQLKREANALRSAGVRLRGLVIWTADLPEVLTPAELTVRRRAPLRSERREGEPAGA